MDLSFLQNIDIYSWPAITLLIAAGFLVGVINTLAGSGTAITYSLFMLMGLPAPLANGTPRLGVIAQTLVASWHFRRKHILDIKKGLVLSIPTILGSLIGAQIAVLLKKDILEIVVGVVMVVMLFFIFYDPNKWIRGKEGKIKEKTTWLQWVIFFAIGIFGGFIHIGVGIFLLAGLVLVSGYDLVRANALKVFIVLMYSPFALAIFMYNHQVHYAMGLISSIGNVAGAFVASRLAVKRGARFLRWILIVVIILFTAKLFGVYKMMGW